MRLLGILACAVALSPVAIASAVPVTPNLGSVQGKGTLTDSDGNTGSWTIDAVLKNGNFKGTGTVVHRGVTVNGALNEGQSYIENGKCYFEIEEGRHRMEIGGSCSTEGIEGRADGFLAGEGVIIGTAKGLLQFGRGSTPTTAGSLPTAKLTCAWMERIGGNVAGDLPRYELRYSNMVTLTLNPAGTYRTNKTSGKFVRQGGTIRLTSGAFAGAVGQLKADRSGRPAVYFERDENRRPDGVHIVDPGRTSCTVARDG